MITTEKQVLNTLFVRLNNPPTNIQLDDLPLNVVPISQHTISIKCELPNDNVLIVSRDQVLVQGFDPSKVQGGLSGYLQQEFRELELLDDITKLSYEEKLPVNITGSTRTSIIRKFQEWKGINYVPKDVHHSIKWSDKAPMAEIEIVHSTPWTMILPEKKEKSKRSTLLSDHQVNDAVLPKRNPTLYVSAHGTNSLQTTSNDTGQVRYTNGKKRQKLRHVVTNDDNRLSIGMEWSNATLSCAYDCLFTILRNVYIN